MHDNHECFACSHGDIEHALNLTRLDVSQHLTVNMAIPADSPVTRDFNYTIGLLQHFDHPEILVIGLPLAAGHVFLSDLRDQIQSGRRFELNTPYDDIAANGFPLIFKKIDEKFHAEYLGYGMRYYRAFEPEKFEKFEAWQMFWSDTNKKFPWDEGYEYPAQVQPDFSAEKS